MREKENTLHKQDVLNTNNATEDKLQSIQGFKEKIQESFISFGELLSDIKRNGIYKVKGYKTFKDFIETEYNISASFAGKLISVYELYIEDLDMDEQTLNEIGFDRLCMIKPIIKDTELDTAEIWIEEAKEKNTSELRQSIKEEKEKVKKELSFKEIFANQYIEKMRTFFNCSVKELNFKLAVYFHDADLNEIKSEIKKKSDKLVQTDGFNKILEEKC